MIQIQPIQNFNGFGSGGMPGEYFYSQGMTKSRFGLVPGWTTGEQRSDTDLPTLGLGNFFSQGVLSGNSYVVMVDASGYIYRNQIGFSSYALFYKPGDSTSGNGLIFDQKNRLLYSTQRYLGQCDPATTADYSTGTIEVTNGSTAVVGTGTTFTAGMVGKMIRVATDNAFYRIATFTDSTHIALSSNYAGSTGSGKTYTIFSSCTDQWKDFGSANSITDPRQMDTYEDWVVIPNNNNFALLNVTDDSFNSSAFTLPSGFKARACRSGRNGILLGANFNNRGVVMLWDAVSDRSIAPWIWFNANIKAIVPVQSTGAWLVITSLGIYECNGYSIKPVFEQSLDDSVNESSILGSVSPQGAEILGKYLGFWGISGRTNRNKAGVYLFNLETATFEFAPVANGCLKGVNGGAIFFDNNNTIHISYTTDNPTKKYIGFLSNTKPATAHYITEILGQGSNKKTAQGVKYDIGISSRIIETAPVLTFNASVKIYNFKRPLWAQAQTNGASATAITIKVNGTVFTGSQVGDEITILDGVNAGQIRHIASIASGGTSSETWTLDTALSNTTESGVNISISPFQLIKKQTITSLSELRDLYYDIQNSIAGKKYLLKVLLDGMTASTVTPEIYGGFFIYDDKGLL